MRRPAGSTSAEISSAPAASPCRRSSAESPADARRTALDLRLADERAAGPADDPAQEPVALELAEGLADGHPADAERLGEVALGRKPRAGRELGPTRSRPRAARRSPRAAASSRARASMSKAESIARSLGARAPYCLDRYSWTAGLMRTSPSCTPQVERSFGRYLVACGTYLVGSSSSRSSASLRRRPRPRRCSGTRAERLVNRRAR